MPADLLLPLMLLLGVCLGALLTLAAYLGDLKRATRFLRERDPRSNARLTRGTRAPGMDGLIDAVNAELDRSTAAQLEALRHQQEFQRDLSALSHDIRTPLTGAKGYLQLAADEPDAAARARMLDAAEQRVDATCELLDALFAYTKSADPDLALEPAPVAVRPVVEEVLLGHYPAFEERGWEPELVFEEDGVSAWCHRESLVRIVENLVVNALRHGAGAPRITERTRDGVVELAVANRVADPAAIDPARLFERFYQADGARGAQGSGLGLSAAANLARAMAGALGATLAGDVLTITLTLPRTGGASAPRGTSGADGGPGQGRAADSATARAGRA